MGTIVVGVDGSQCSRKALSWATDEAALRGADLLIVHTWQIPVMAGSEMVYVAPPNRAAIRTDVRVGVQTLVDETGVEGRGVPYTIELAEGRAGAELVRLAATADLLVVGSHGAGTVHELLLGSTSNYCVHHAPCPIVVVRTKATK